MIGANTKPLPPYSFSPLRIYCTVLLIHFSLSSFFFLFHDNPFLCFHGFQILFLSRFSLFSLVFLPLKDTGPCSHTHTHPPVGAAHILIKVLFPGVPEIPAGLRPATATTAVKQTNTCIFQERKLIARLSISDYSLRHELPDQSVILQLRQ